MARSALRRPRGLNLLVGGTVAVLGLLVISLVGGGLDMGLGAPEVRIDGPASASQ
ncbi:MAG: hypothetical protein WBA25_16815 [Jannaschia sp.]